MKIVLATLNAKFIHTSLSLRYLRAYTKEAFPNTDLVEYTIKDPTDLIVADIYRRHPDVVAFSVYIWNVEETFLVLDKLKLVLPQVKIILGGPEVSYDTKYWMERGGAIDFIVMGEGEATYLHLLQELNTSQRWNEISGLAWRKENQISLNPARTKMDLQTIPNPYADENDMRALQSRVVYFESSRGCPFSCQFCLSSIESGVRYFELERVKQNLAHLMDAGIQTIKFVDRTFNLHRQYALQLFQFLIEYPSQTIFQFEITGDILPDEIVDFLSRYAPVHRFRFEIGVQSTNEMTNTLVQRRQNFEKLRRTIEKIRDSQKIIQHLDLIAGLPEENYASFKKTFNDVFLLEPDELQLGFLKLLRGTGLRMVAHKYGYRFVDRAPYEIIESSVLSYDELLQIKQVEDVLEKYWNQQRLRRTVSFLIHTVFTSPFDFFQQFGAYWEKQGWSRIGHQLEDLFSRLHEFLHSISISTETKEICNGLMYFEFLLAHRIRPHRPWWKHTLSKQERIHMIEHIVTKPKLLGEAFVKLGLNRSDIEKHTVIEQIQCDPHMRPEWMMEAQTVLLVYYPPGLEKGKSPLWFCCSMTQLNDENTCIKWG